MNQQDFDPQSAPHILLVDDDRQASSALVRALRRQEALFQFLLAETRDQALALAAEHQPHVAVVDLSLDPNIGPQSGLLLIEELQEKDPTIRILTLTGHGADEFGIEALQRGAASFLEKPADAAHLLALINDGVSYASLKRQYLQLCSTPEQLSRVTGLCSRSPLMLKVIENVAFASTNKQPVLITGETGVGKGLIAQAIHSAGRRVSAPFIRFQPSYGSPDLVASELFGHQKGSFTGATEHRRGLLEEAHQGTLFIDEVGELPQETQVLLLNALQERVFRRIGDNKEYSSDFRLITATNKSIDELLKDKFIRGDFYHRIAHFTINLPPLCQRVEDIPDLARHFLSNVTNRENLPVQGLSPEALHKLEQHHWPGNVRELQAVVEGGVYPADYHERRFVEVSDLHFSSKQNRINSAGGSFRERVRQYEMTLITEALQQHGGNQSKAAESLQLDRSVLRRILKREGN